MLRENTPEEALTSIVAHKCHPLVVHSKFTLFPALPLWPVTPFLPQFFAVDSWQLTARSWPRLWIFWKLQNVLWRCFCLNDVEAVLLQKYGLTTNPWNPMWLLAQQWNTWHVWKILKVAHFWLIDLVTSLSALDGMSNKCQHYPRWQCRQYINVFWNPLIGT